MFISVVLPAPFSPSSATISPGRASKSTLSSARRAPKRRVILRATSIGCWRSGGWRRTVARTHVVERLVAGGQRAVKLLILDVLEDRFEVRSRRESHRDQVVA